MNSSHSLKQLNSWQVGGSCSSFYTPVNIPAAIKAYKDALHKDNNIYVLGGGSNVLIQEGLFVASIIHTLALDNMRHERTSDNVGIKLEVESGVTTKAMLAFSIANKLTGLEFLTGIPGTIGGALWGNAGVGAKGLKNIVSEVETIEMDGSNRIWKNKELNWNYRTSPFDKKTTVMITKATFILKETTKEQIYNTINKYAVLKKGQPLGKKTAGCVFKNPEGMFAGQLLEKSGCKGLSFGGAQVSASHANFIENTGDATASDIYNLSELCRKRVYDNYGVKLEYEICFFGNFQKEND